MRYETPAAFRTALEQWVRSGSESSGITHGRLRNQIVFERIAVRLDHAEPGRWVVKGGHALVVRLGAGARTTTDLDLGVRDEETSVAGLRDRLIEALSVDPDGDWCTFTVGPAQVLGDDATGRPTLRFTVGSALAGRPFGDLKVDVSPRPEELGATERLLVGGSLEFAGISARSVEVVDANQHAAEKLHALTRDYGDRPNTRTRDLVDLVLLIAHGHLDDEACRRAVASTFAARGLHEVPGAVPDVPAGWAAVYERLADDVPVDARRIEDAMDVVRDWWARVQPSSEA